MFQYTREFIINEDLHVDIKKVGNDTIVSFGELATYKNGLDQGGMPRILDVMQVPYKSATVPVLPIAWSGTTEKKLTIDMKLYRATEASYANNLHANMYRTIIIEFKEGMTITQALQHIKNSIRAYDGNYFTVAIEGSNIVLTGTEPEQRLRYTLQIPNPTSELGHDDYWADATPSDWVNGDAGHGNYRQLIKNNRLPTVENLKFTSVNENEMPCKSGKYVMVQWTYNSGIRNIGGQGVVGSYERSMTKHRFWINEAGEAMPNLISGFKALFGVEAVAAAAHELEEGNPGVESKILKALSADLPTPLDVTPTSAEKPTPTKKKATSKEGEAI